MVTTYSPEIMAYAEKVASRSTCLRRPTGVGCVIVDDVDDILCEGFASSLPGLPTCTKVGCLVVVGDPGCLRTLHAEQAVIINSTMHRCSLYDCIAYCTLSPCISCYKLLVATGIKHIFVKEMYRKQDYLLLDCKVKVELVL